MSGTPYICFVKQDVIEMQCEICGREVPFLKKVKIGTAVMNVCERCRSFGEEVREVRREEPQKRVTRSSPRTATAEFFAEELIPNYSEVIREARKRKGMTQEDLAKKIKEKVSLIKKIENGELTPEEKVVKKLEKELDIKLMERVETPRIERKEMKESLTLGDVVVVRRKSK